MKILFAVNNDDVSNAIVKKYQKKYREILSYKNVYYFNAILRELQKDKTYDRVVISEDLEPFANNNYDAIDKFLFDKLDKISDEAINVEGEDTAIIFICSDRRNKSDEMLSKLFGIGVYNAIIEQDRSTDVVCDLIYKPRGKKEAKQYYRINVDKVGYKTENENSVNEVEVQNILNHFKKLGKNEDKYINSFDNIVTQYNDEQLKIIIRYLPINVKAVLEEKSPKYQQLVSNGSYDKSLYRTKEDNKNKIQVEMLKNEAAIKRISRPIVIPSSVNKKEVKRLIKQEKPKITEEINNNEINEDIDIDDNDIFNEDIDNINENIDINENVNNIENINEDIDIDDNDIFNEDVDSINEDIDISNNIDFNIDTDINNGIAEGNNDSTTVKRGRGRPRKNPLTTEEDKDKPKRGRGRPRKNLLPVIQDDQKEDNNDIDLFNLDEEDVSNKKTSEEDIDLFGLDEEDDSNEKSNEEDIDLFDLDEENDELSKDNVDKDDEDLFELDKNEDADNDFYLNNDSTIKNETDIEESNYRVTDIPNLAKTLTKDKKIVSFVGTTKNGTSFIVNNAAHLLASMGISTAILDLTKTRNAYYIYTNSEEQLMNIAKNSIKNLRSGIAEGIKVNKYLTVYTSLPDDNNDYTDVDNILSTLVNNHSVVLIDCDFDTPMDYFGASQELYLVQSMDVLTMQPLTAFLRNMQSKGFLRQEKIKIVINKTVNIKSVSIKTLIGGISKYNDPSMTYMKDLFNKDIVPYCLIPFEVQNYIKYLDAVINCTISLNGYTKAFMNALKQLCDMIYPLVNKQTYSPRGVNNNNFSVEMNDTLNKMKRTYN